MLVEDAKAIELCGASRIELVSALTEGGLTLSYAIKASAYLLKETILKKLGDAEGGTKVLLEYLEKDFCKPYIGIVYHNLAVNYGD